MSLATLLNRPVTIIGRSASGDEDAYGNDVATETLTETVCELQQVRREEPAGEGETTRTDWLLILPAGTPVRTGDIAVVGGLEYELVGDPWQARNPRTRVESHIEATCRRTGGGYDEAAGS
jgi:hypothetical protein